MTTATRDVKELEAEILRAHGAGDKATLARLQAEYRSSGHPVERISPAPITLRWGSGAQRSRSSSWPAILDDPPEIRGRSAGAPTVVLTAGVQADFNDFNDEISDGREAAGGLYGRVAGNEIVVEAATLIRDQLRERKSVHIDNWQLNADADHFRAAGWALLGDWHSHVEGGPASETDRRAWATTARQRSRIAAWVGLVIEAQHDWLRSDDDWTKLQYTVYLTDETGIETARAIIEA
jgi:hypothetical protein